MAGDDSAGKKPRHWARWGVIAVPLGLLLGLIMGVYLGNAAIGIAIGAAVGFGAAAALFAASVAFRSSSGPGTR
jgi:hypothetical protein